jgi:hypothetical protein
LPRVSSENLIANQKTKIVYLTLDFSLEERVIKWTSHRVSDEEAGKVAGSVSLMVRNLLQTGEH